MPTCRGCGTVFPNWVIVNEKKRNVAGRVFCLTCSPYGQHNTRAYNPSLPRPSVSKHCSHCGETDPKKFYGHKRTICGSCHNKYTLQLGQLKRIAALDKLGGKCCLCGFDAYTGALDIHHLDPAKKDSRFDQHRSWSLARLLAEVDSCVLLCRNCHVMIHANLLTIPTRS